jgi:hypothetical protein
MFSSPVSQSVQMEEIFLLYLDFIFCSIYDCVTSLLFISPDFILIGSFAMRNEKDHTFINRIQEVIQKYKLEPVEKLMEQPKSKEEWKRIVKFHQNIYWQTIQAFFPLAFILFISYLTIIVDY